MPSKSDAVVGIFGKGVPGVSAGRGSGRERPGCHPAFVGLLHTSFCHLLLRKNHTEKNCSQFT